MIFTIKQILNHQQLAKIKQVLENSNWLNGNLTAGHQAFKVKNNQQLLPNNPPIKSLSDEIISTLEANDIFISATLPARIFPPAFNRYSQGEFYGAHIDNAIRPLNSDNHQKTWFRSDISATIFLNDPNSYEGGELVIKSDLGVQQIKLNAGDMIIYPANTIHQVNEVKSGVRLASFFWIESMVKNSEERSILFDIDSNIRNISQKFRENNIASEQGITELTGIYHNLLRKWANIS
ncbi:MAG: Fe2+-dependent dioxygenase [Rickettsiales bacterium]|nr:Fe2+-dependent dioxygenase [Rickettsiales bacterium]